MVTVLKYMSTTFVFQGRGSPGFIYNYFAMTLFISNIVLNEADEKHILETMATIWGSSDTTEFCQDNTLVIANTLFQHKRRLYTWTLSIEKSD